MVRRIQGARAARGCSQGSVRAWQGSWAVAGMVWWWWWWVGGWVGGVGWGRGVPGRIARDASKSADRRRRCSACDASMRRGATPGAPLMMPACCTSERLGRRARDELSESATSWPVGGGVRDGGEGRSCSSGSQEAAVDAAGADVWNPRADVPVRGPTPPAGAPAPCSGLRRAAGARRWRGGARGAR